MKANGDVKLAAIPPEAAAILKLTRVDRLFETFDSTADAVNSFNRSAVEPFHVSSRYAATSTDASSALTNSLEDHPPASHEMVPVSQVGIGTTGSWLRRQIAGTLLLLLIAPFAHASPFPQQEANPSPQVEGVSSSQANSQDADSGAKNSNTEPSPSEALPNSPGTVRSQDQLSSEQQPSSKLQSGTQEPLGTAVAPPVKTTGVAASRPAGAAIAPAKQRRSRSILIKVSAIVGAGVAVGTVVGLSRASPSRAPGSR